MTLAGIADLATGTLITVWLSTLGIALGVPLGLFLALLRVWRVPGLCQLAAVYVSVIRATPLVTLALFVFFGLPAIGLEMPLMSPQLRRSRSIPQHFIVRSGEVP